MGVALGQLAFAQPQAVFQAHAHIAAHARRNSGNAHLVATRAQHGPLVVAAKQAVGGTAHVHHIFGVHTYAAQNAKHRLHKKWRLHQATLCKMRQVVKVPNVVTLKLKPRAVALQLLQLVLNVLKRVSKNQVFAFF